jgi:hypothetical protein
VKVIVQQQPGVHVHPVRHRRIGQYLAPVVAVRIVQHDELAVVAPLHHMVGVAGQGDAGQSGHERERRDAMSL